MDKHDVVCIKEVLTLYCAFVPELTFNNCSYRFWFSVEHQLIKTTTILIVISYRLPVVRIIYSIRYVILQILFVVWLLNSTLPVLPSLNNVTSWEE